MIRPAKLISGGQTGADLAGLRAGHAMGIPTGGWAPRGWLTERGAKPFLGTRYGLQEHRSSRYTARTEQNVIDCSGVVIFGDLKHTGSARTIQIARTLGKHWIANPTAAALKTWWTDLMADFAVPDAYGILNVAGNRESVNPGIEDWVYWILLDAWATDRSQVLTAEKNRPNYQPRFHTPPDFKVGYTMESL